MSTQKMNMLISFYRKSRDNDVFNAIYKEFIEKPMEVYEAIAESLKAPVHEVIALYEDTLLHCIDSYNGKTDFERYFNRAIKLERANLYNRQRRRMKREWLESDLGYAEEYEVSDDTLSPLEMAVNNAMLEDNSAATEFIKRSSRKTKADQRQLIDFLVRNSDASTTAIVEAFPRHKSITALGKALGLHHMQVKRKLEMLACNFDSKQFGDYRDYLVAY